MGKTEYSKQVHAVCFVKFWSWYRWDKQNNYTGIRF